MTTWLAQITVAIIIIHQRSHQELVSQGNLQFPPSGLIPLITPSYKKSYYPLEDLSPFVIIYPFVIYSFTVSFSSISQCPALGKKQTNEQNKQKSQLKKHFLNEWMSE